MPVENHEDELLRSSALQNAQSILAARHRTERELVEAQEALRAKSEELAQSLAMMRATFESTTDGILVVDQAGQVTDFNAQFAKMWRMPPEVMASRDRRQLLAIAAPQLTDGAAFITRTESIYASNPPESFDLIEFADGRVFERCSKVQRIENRTVGRVWSYRDVTQRRRAEEEVRRRREWFEVTLSSIGDAVITTDTDARVTFLNPVAEALTGWRASEAVGRLVEEVFRIIHEGTRELAVNPVREVLRSRLTVALANHTALLSRDGREIAIEDSAAPIKDGSGRITGVVMVFHDVTERRRAQDALRASHAQFSAILNQSPVGVFLVDAQLRIQHVNPKAGPVFGGIGDVLDRNLADILRILWPDHVAAEVLGRFRDTLETGHPFFQNGFAEERKDRHVQEFYDWEIHRIVLPNEDHGVVCYFIDISAHVLAQQAVRRSEEELRALANSIPQLAWMANPDGHIFWYNRGWYDYTGKTFEEMQGWGWQSVHRPDILPQVVARWTRSIESGQPFEMEFPLRGADGAFRWFLTRVNPLRDEGGAVVRWFGTNTDVDQVRRAQDALQEETRVLDLLNSTGQAIAAQLNLETLVQTVSDAGTELSGAKFGAFIYKVANAQGEAMLLYTLSGAPGEAFDPFGLPGATPFFNPTFHGERVARSADITRDSRYGTMPPHAGMLVGRLPVRSYLAASVVSRSGEVIGGLFFGHPEPDVFTERSERLIVGVAAQAAVAIDNARLYEAAQKEIAERTRAEEQLAAARDVAETANQAKDHFIAALSHELRTPLTPVLAILSSLRNDVSLPEAVATDLETVRRNVELETRLIDDLLDLTRISRGKLELKREQRVLAPLIEDAITTCLPDLLAKRLTLVREIKNADQPIVADCARVTQILWNVLKNAIKFTPEGGTITVRSHVFTSGPHGEVTIEIADTGIGIDPAQLPRVFEAFEQGDRHITRQFGGLGLGLAISKAIAERHGGRLSAKSEGEGRGSTFALTLPLGREDEFSNDYSSPMRGRKHSAEGEGAIVRVLRILLVEDHPDSAAVLSRLLRAMGHDVTHCATVRSALSAAENEARPAPFDLVLSDIGLPDGSGLDLMRELSTRYRLRGVALSGFGMDADLEQSKRAGFSHHLVKPVDIDALRAVIAEVTSGL